MRFLDLGKPGARRKALQRLGEHNAGLGGTTAGAASAMSEATSIGRRFAGAIAIFAARIT